jgi:septal ring factor EnvC (AmiA/AmiB activator)
MRRDFSLKALAAIAILTSTLMANDVEEIDSRISQTKGEITRIETREDTLQNRVDRLSDRIMEAESRLGEISTQLETIDRQIATLQKAVETEQESYDRLKKERSTLAVQRDRVEKRLLDLLAKHISQSLVFSQSEPAQESDLIREQLFDVVKARSSRSVEHLQDDFIRLEKALNKLQTRIDEMTQRRDELDRNRERQSSLQAEQKRTLRELSGQKEQYLAQLNELIEQRNRQRQMLADLNVMRQKAVDEMHQARISREQAQQQRQAQRLKVRQLGSSYQAASQARYRGQRVKPPLDDRYQISLVKEFGPYTDPVYNIRIHNDSVTLKADEDEAVVRSVLSGTVIFAEDMRLLGRVVILEHPGNLHTIYRNLDEIAPHVKVGQNIRARQSIGRVHQELVFEVTKDGLPINPMQLIAISK